MSAAQADVATDKTVAHLMVAIEVLIPGEPSQIFWRPVAGLNIFDSMDALDASVPDAACPLPAELVLSWPVYVNGVEVPDGKEETTILQPGDKFTITDP